MFVGLLRFTIGAVKNRNRGRHTRGVRGSFFSHNIRESFQCVKTKCLCDTGYFGEKNFSFTSD